MVHRRALEPHRRHVLSPMLTPETRAFLEHLTGRALTDDAPWIEALTHGSTGEDRHYQRLEFLGDRVLGLAIAEWLHETGQDNEGKLSQRLNALVSGGMCADVGRAIGLGPHMRLGKQARDDGGHDSDNILGDVVEALIGASFIAWGYDGARALVRSLWDEAFSGHSGKAKHPKSALQEWAAGNRRKLPEYRLLERSGPDHAARFTVEVAVPGIGGAQATANSKQDAETQAAAEFMRLFG
jgi:ribonuclease III